MQNKIALISVSDKTGIVQFAENLKSFGYQILATGNTAKLLGENGIDLINVSDFTGFPEIFDGRVKTLHPKIFGGILMRRDNVNDVKESEVNNIEQIDIVCVNLYPFKQVVDSPDSTTKDKIENIDIGGPSLIRAAAKNYESVSVLTSPSQYENFAEALAEGKVDIEYRKKLAAEAFSLTTEYDSFIADYFERELLKEPNHYRLNLKLNRKLRYGENPHQEAFLYGDFDKYFEVLHGKELSYNNIVDLVAAVEIVSELEPYSCAIIKHTNACGAASSGDTFNSYVNALACDPVSAFGGIVAFNSKVDEKTAHKLNEIFLEIIIAPDFSGAALEILKKKKNRRLVKILSNFEDINSIVKSIPGGILVQDKDKSVITDDMIKNVTERKCTDEELENLKFAWKICKHTKSNAIVFVKNKMAIGVGAGQMSRIDSVKLAANRAKEHGHDLAGAVAASDAFFPFPDGIEEMSSYGITSVIQPGGSIRDEEVIDAANKLNISMVFTGIRNFKH